MSCNVDLLHIGIYTLAAGISLMMASAMNFQVLAPYEKEAKMKERNDIALAAKQTLVQKTLSSQKQLNFRV